MSETELSVICKNCGSEVSPYVTECPYCGARLRKRAPKLERRGDALEPKPRRRGRRLPQLGGRLRGRSWAEAERPYATLAAIVGSAVLLLVQKATGDPLQTFGGLILPFAERLVAGPDRSVRLRRRRLPVRRRRRPGDLLDRRSSGGSAAPRPRSCWSPAARWGCSPQAGSSTPDGFKVIAGGNGMALGALAAWFTIRRAETQGAIDQEYDWIGVAVAAAVLLALPIFDSTANVYAGHRRRRGRRPRRARRRRSSPPWIKRHLLRSRAGTLIAAGVLVPALSRPGMAWRLVSGRALRRAHRGGDRAADGLRALRRGRADRLARRAAAAARARLGPRRGRLVRRVAPLRGAARPRRSPTPTSGSPRSARCSPRRREWR